jgi:integrase
VVAVATVTEKIPYYRVKNGVGYWEPPAWARVKPYDMEGLTCGPDGPAARELARGRVELMRRLRTSGEVATIAPEWPSGSLGRFYERWTRTPGFGKKAQGTRREFDQAWAHVPDRLKRKKITTIQAVEIERLHIDLETKGEWTRWRTIKKLREIFAAAKAHGIIPHSPAQTMSNPEPEGRSQLWTAAEVQTLIDKADELGKPDMALSIALAWATMVSPVDVRTLTRAMVFEDKGGLYIERKRSKTGVGIMADLDDWTTRRLRLYLGDKTVVALPSTPIIRQESGRAFKDRHDFARRFATIRKAAFGPDEKRQMRDIRRSANVEADLGGASADDRAKILGNALNTDPKLERTYTPPTLAKARELRKQREAGREIFAAVKGERQA